jgi:hypothetical protein
VSIYESVFEACSARTGGALALAAPLTRCLDNAFIGSSVFVDNYASSGSAIFYDSTTTITIVNVTFANNSGILSTLHIDNGNRINITDTRFVHNSATIGAALSVVNAELLNVQRVYVSDNYCREGTVRIGEVTSVTVDNSTFARNKVKGRGGALLLSSSNPNIFVATDCYFVSNSADSGGAMLVAAMASNVNVSTSTFENNAANDGA